MTSLTELLGSRRASILERWTQRIRWELAPPELSRGELWDHLPHILDELVEALRAAEGRAAASPLPEESPASVRHGTQRLRVGFDVEEVVREYGLLEEIVLDEFAATGQTLDTREWRLAMQCFNTAIAEAIAAYVKRRDEEIRRQTERHIGFVAHELRNPLGTARSAAAALQLTSTDGRLYSVLDRSLRQVGELVDAVLTADRLASRAEIKREPVDLTALAQDVVQDARPAAESRDVKITLEVDEPLEVEADRRLLASVVGNLVGNAVKFSQAGGTVRVRAGREGDGALLQVQDECGGLPPGNLDDLFEPFVQRGDNRSGFGLGLAIARQAISAHGGQVSVRNEPGKGCTFEVTLPAKADPRG